MQVLEQRPAATQRDTFRKKVQRGIRSGQGLCCRVQPAAVHAPASHLGHTATLLASCTDLHCPLLRASHLPVLRNRQHPHCCPPISCHDAVNSGFVGGTKNTCMPCF